MPRSSTIRARGAQTIVSLVLCASGAWGLAACSSGTGSPSPGSSGGPAANSGSDDGLGATSGSGAPASGSGSASAQGGAGASGGNDAGTSPDGSPDSGLRDIGGCCTPQTTPGCNDPNVELCVCQKDPDCCTKGWTLACTLIVQQKYCQAGVRDCVCGTDAGQWAQTDCCSSDWNSSCDSVATLKCSAARGCF